MTRAAIYTRVSSLAQSTEGTSLETQEQSCRQYADAGGYTVVGVWTDVHTGADLHERRGMSVLREAIRDGAVDVLIAHAIDRITRDQIHLGVLMDECDRSGVRLEFVTEDFEQSAVGQFMRNAKAFAAEVEREKIRERSMRGKAKRLSEGKLPTWTCPLYGYRWDHDKSSRVIREDEAEIVRFIFRSVADGVSLHEICRQLNGRGVPSPGVTRMRYQTPKTPIWHASSMHHAITNPAYKGISVANRLTRVKFRNPDTGKVNKSRQRVKPESEWTILPAELTPALVDVETWQAANDRLRDNRGIYSRNKRRPYLLRGLMHCQHCGGAMYSEQEGGKNQRRVYRCANGKKSLCEARTRVIADEVENWVWRQVLYILSNRDAVVAELQWRYNQRSDLSLDTERRLLAQRVEELTGRQSRLIQREGSVPWSHIEREVNRLEEEKAGLQARLSEVEAAISDRDSQAIRVDAVIALIDRLVAGDPESASFEERVRILNDIGIGVRIGKLLWKLDWFIPIEGQNESGQRWFIDFTGVEEPADPAERKRIEDETWIESLGVPYTPTPPPRCRSGRRRSPARSYRHRHRHP